MSETEAPVDAAASAEQARENVDAWISGDPAKQESRPDNGAPSPSGKEGDSVYVADPRVQDEAPKGEAAIVQRAATTLSELGPEGEALVQEWGGHTSHDFQENLAYARNAFRDIAANRPDLIAKVDASGLGNDPMILKILAEHGRMQANTLGDNTVERNYGAPSESARPLPRGQSAAQAELNKIYKETPPGSEGYRANAVQNRVRQLNEAIHGTGNIVGTGGRTA
jgi:hypothetical protein